MIFFDDRPNGLEIVNECGSDYGPVQPLKPSQPERVRWSRIAERPVIKIDLSRPSVSDQDLYDWVREKADFNIAYSRDPL